MSYQRERKQLADRLRALREAAGFSGAALARELGGGWRQPKISKIENQRQLPSEDDIRAWAAATHAGDDVVEELLEIRDSARVEYTEWQETFREIGAAGAQAQILAMEAQAVRIGEFQPSMISGLVQTAEYARESLHIPSGPAAFGSSEDDIEEMIANRMRRQQVLYDPQKRVEIVMLESALRVKLCSDETLAGQLDRLIAVSGLAGVEIRIVPFEAQVPVFPLSGFRIYDDALVIVESISGEQELSDPEEVERYARFFDLLRDAGGSGSDAVHILRRAMDVLAQG